MTFPKDFLWGAATASYQIEGGDPDDGRGECIWQRFSHTPGKVVNGDTGDVAADHYHRYREDVALMRELGFQTYRFSVSWARVLPTGVGESNPKGLDFYDRLVDELLAANIIPFVTLYHWDLPQALQDRGGWANPEIVGWFSDYTDLMSRRLGDRVKNWTTHNEPAVVAWAGNLIGVHAPGIQDMRVAVKVAHYLHLAHGAAVPIIRQNVPDANVGIVLNNFPIDPASDDPRDVQAAQLFDGMQNRWYLDPVFRGEYPEDMVALLGSALDGIDLDEIKKAAVRLDWLGINYYNRLMVRYSPNNPPGYFEEVKPEGAEYTAMNWEVIPEGLTRILVRINDEYQPKALYVTENGAAFNDPAPANGVVDDPRRVAYLESHIKATEAAIEQGAPVKGYFVWSFLDNFEWAEGYAKRFGIVYVDYATQQRTPKQSARYYQSRIAAPEKSL